VKRCCFLASSVTKAQFLLMRYLCSVMLFLLLMGCQGNTIGLVISPGWSYHSLGAWKQLMPNKMALGPDGRWLYFGSELSEYSGIATVAALNVETGRTRVLVEGLRNVLGLGFAPDKSLWVAEGEARGEIWRMVDAAHFPEDQQVIAQSGGSTHPGFASFLQAGRFAHRAIAFSSDKQMAYLADMVRGGYLYRLDLSTRSLAVLHEDKGWLRVDAEDAVAMASQQGARAFNAISDIERLPSGMLLLAESGAGQVLQLDDGGEKPTISQWLPSGEMKSKGLQQPVDLSWDASRNWLWIADQGTPSTLWVWDGHHLSDVVHHLEAQIRGVLASPGGSVYVSLQRSRYTPSVIFVLKGRREPD